MPMTRFPVNYGESTSETQTYKGFRNECFIQRLGGTMKGAIHDFLDFLIYQFRIRAQENALFIGYIADKGGSLIIFFALGNTQY